jgi:hypothetical protein
MRPSDLRYSPPLSAAFSVLALIGGLYIVATTVLMVMDGWSALPFSDQWDELILDPGGLSLRWLFAQHNEHRILFPKLLFAIDAFAFSETNRFNFFCNLALPAILAALLIWIARRNDNHGIFDTAWLAGVVLATLFSALQWENFLWGFQVQFFGVDLAVAAGIAWLVLGGSGVWSLAAAIICEAIAVFTLSSGAVMLPLAIVLAFLAGRSKAQILALVVVAAALMAVYLHGYVHPPGHADPLVSLHRPMRLILHALVDLGSPIGHGVAYLKIGNPQRLSALFGFIGFVLYGLAVLVYLGRFRPISGPPLAFLGIAGYSIGFTLLAGSGRINFGLGQALSPRYNTPTLLFWLCLFLLAAVELRPLRPGPPLAMRCAGFAVVVGLVSVQHAAVKTGLEWAEPRRTATAALLAGVYDRDALFNVYPFDPARVARLADALRERRLSIFADDWGTWRGTPLFDHVAGADPARCRGGIDRVVSLPAAGSEGRQMIGWSWDDAAGQAARRIVLADDGGRVVGYGLGGYPAGKPGRFRRSDWRGYYRAAADVPITAYALVDGGRAACPLARWQEAR